MKRLALALLITAPAVVVYLITSIGGRQDGRSQRVVRVILNTNVTPTWNEIDAVELVGPDGRAWASGAVASSNYGQ